MYIYIDVVCLYMSVSTVTVYIIFLTVLHADNWEALQNASSQNSETGLHDVWDGAALHSLCTPGRFFSDGHNLALSLSTNGVLGINPRQ